MTPHVTQLFSLLADQGDFPRLAETVVRAESKMTEAGERDLWLFWRAHSLTLLGQLEEARGILPQIRDRERIEAIDLTIKRVAADRDGDRGSLVAALEERYEKSRDPLHLIELCDAYQSIQRWEEVAKHAKIFVEGVKTPAALALGIEAAQRTSNPALVLELLNGREGLFPSNVLPLGFRRGRVLALSQMGHPERALEEVEVIARETDDSRDIINVVSMRLQCADPKGAVIAARKLLTRDDVSAESHLRLANSLRIEDHAAATAHLERALAKKDDSPQFVAAAMDLSFKLNREDKLAELQPAVVKAATAGGPILMAGPEKMVEILREQNERRMNAETLYTGGRIPLHLALEFVGGTMAGVYHSRFQPFDAAKWPPAAPIYVMHGGRAAVPAPRTLTRLNVDTSSLLLAAELGILDSVEQAFAPLFLPHGVVGILYRHLDEATPHQPSKLDEARIIAALLGSNSIKVSTIASEKENETSINRPSADWLKLLAAARKNGGVLVDYLPVTVGFPPRTAELQGDEPTLVVGIASVLKSLEDAAVISAEASATARRKLYSFANGETRTIPRGASLFVRGNIAEVLAGAGLLEAAAQYFKVTIEAEEEQRVRGTLLYEEKNQELRASLKALLDRLQKGLGTTWRLLPQVKLEENMAARAETICLAELMKSAEVASDGQVWIDDRYLNAFASCGRLPIVTIRDVLRELVARGAMELPRFYSLIQRMRSANLRYIPLKSEELIYYLGQAAVRNDDLVETPELALIRRYTAACFSDRGTIQMPPVAEGIPNREGEIALLPSFLEATRETLTSLWSKVTSENVVEIKAKADWLLHSIWCDAAALSWIVGNRANVPKELYGSSLAQLYVHGLGLRGSRRHTDKGPSPREHYFRWLAGRVAHDLESVEGAGKHLADVFKKEKWPKAAAEQGLVNTLLGEFLHDLPQDINKALNLSKETLRRYGIEYVDTITIENHSFDGRSFWPSAERAMKGKTVRVQDQESNSVFMLSFAQTDKGPTLLLAQEGGTAQTGLSSPSFVLLDQDRLKRRQLLRTHWEWFDCERTQFDQEAKRIANNPQAEVRFHKLERWKARSAEQFYRNLAESRRARRSVSLKDFSPPVAHGLLSHLRLGESTGSRTIEELIRRSASELLQDVGIADAFRRLAALPCVLPSTLEEALVAMEPGARAEWVAKSKEEFSSPPSFLHFVCIYAQFEPADALQVLEAKVNNGAQKEFEAFQLVHFWALSQLELRSEVNRWAGKTKLALAWLHAARLFDILSQASSPEVISEFFAGVIRPTVRDVFDSKRDLETEAIHPRQLRFRSFYVHALLAMWPKGGWSETDQGRVDTILRKLCFIDAEKPWPHPDLLLPAEWLQNTFGSFITGDRSAALRESLKDEAALFSTDFASHFLADYFRQLSEWTSDEPTSWTILESIVGVNRLPGELHQKAVELAADPRLVALVVRAPAVRKPALWFLAHQCCGSKETKATFADQLVKLSRELTNVELSDPELDEVTTLIVECAHVMATAEPTPQRASEEFSSLMIRILGAWPSAIDEFWTKLQGLTARLSPSVAVGLWPLVLELRKRTRSTTARAELPAPSMSDSPNNVASG